MTKTPKTLLKQGVDLKFRIGDNLDLSCKLLHKVIINQKRKSIKTIYNGIRFIKDTNFLAISGLRYKLFITGILSFHQTFPFSIESHFYIGIAKVTAAERNGRNNNLDIVLAHCCKFCRDERNNGSQIRRLIRPFSSPGGMLYTDNDETLSLAVCSRIGDPFYEFPAKILLSSTGG